MLLILWRGCSTYIRSTDPLREQLLRLAFHLGVLQGFAHKRRSGSPAIEVPEWVLIDIRNIITRKL